MAYMASYTYDLHVTLLKNVKSPACFFANLNYISNPSDTFIFLFYFMYSSN